MPFRPQPMDLAFTQARYPSPDWKGRGLVARVFIPDDETVGWLVLQGDTLAWLSASGPKDAGYGVRRAVDVLVQDGADTGRKAQAVWDQALGMVLHEPPDEAPLSTVLAAATQDWA